MDFYKNMLIRRAKRKKEKYDTGLKIFNALIFT